MVPFFPNVIHLLNAHIEGQLGLLTVTTIPKTRPERFIRTRRTGGFRRDQITDVARVTFEAWAGSDTDAEHDVQLVRDLAYDLRGFVFETDDGKTKIHRVDEVAGPADSPDVDSNHPRYTLTLEVHLRGRTVRSDP